MEVTSGLTQEEGRDPGRLARRGAETEGLVDIRTASLPNRWALEICCPLNLKDPYPTVMQKRPRRGPQGSRKEGHLSVTCV